MRTALFYGVGAMLLGSLAVAPAHAVVISYSTTGVFGCGTAVGCTVGSSPSSIKITGGGNFAMLTYSPNTGTFLNPGPPPPQNVNYGTITSKSLLSTPAEAFNGATFTMTIDETLPDVTNGNISATLTGTVEATGSTAQIDFANDGIISLGSVTYEIGNNGVVQLSAPSAGIRTSKGVTSITGIVTATTGGGGGMLPEPTFMALTGLGVFGLAGMAYRRRRANKEA
jgi:hypothetical protein